MESIFKDFADAASDWFWETDAAGRFTYLSDRFYEVSGTKPSSIIGKTNNELGRYIEKPEDIERVAHALAAHEPYKNVIASRVLPDGRRLWVRTGGVPVFDERGRFSGYRGTSTDISESMRAEANLREQANLLQMILDNVPAIVAFRDQDARFVFANKKGAAVHALHPSEFVGRTLAEAHGETAATDSDNFALQVLATKQPVLDEVYQPSSLPDRWFRGNFLPVFDRDENIAGVISVVEDITERRRADEQLSQSQKMEALGELTGGVAHDFNNILAVIRGNLDLIALQLRSGGNVADYLQPAVDATARAATLTKRLLAFARRQPLNLSDVDIHGLVSGMSDMLHSSLSEAVEIEIVSNPDESICHIDSAQLEQVILNLAINARDAMPTGGRLRISVGNITLDRAAVKGMDIEPGDFVELSVNDTGTGIPAEILDQMFEPFFTTKEAGKGTGLGLSMAFGFIKQSGGHILAESTLGEGTTFRLFLPRIEAKSVNAASVMGPSMQGAAPGEVILVVEDDADLCALVVNQLEQLGFQVFKAGDGNAALEILSGGARVDLLLCDVVLPGGMNGPDIVVKARQTRPELKVAYMSGYTDDADLHQDGAAPNVELLHKPFQLDELACTLRSALDA